MKILFARREIGDWFDLAKNPEKLYMESGKET